MWKKGGGSTKGGGEGGAKILDLRGKERSFAQERSGLKKEEEERSLSSNPGGEVSSGDPRE